MAGGWRLWLEGLFAKDRQGAETPESIERYLAYLDTLARPAIRLVKSDTVGNSRLGGLPDLPADLEWPEWQGQALAFLGQIDLADLPPACRGLGLPASGLLFFFYDAGQGAWGFDPADRGAFRVLYALAPGPERAPPPTLAEDAVYPVMPVAFMRVTTYPEPDDPALKQVPLTSLEWDRYCDLRTAAASGYAGHRLLGYPDPVQNGDMERECALVTGGLYCGNTEGYNDPRAAELSRHRDDWVLLLQLDSDDDAAMMWGDVGTLYFWVRKQDLAANNFADCWMISQCH
jgi:uncharacterized protein YwqG